MVWTNGGPFRNVIQRPNQSAHIPGRPQASGLVEVYTYSVNAGERARFSVVYNTMPPAQNKKQKAKRVFLKTLAVIRIFGVDFP